MFFRYNHMLCLVGGQGAGKSTFFRLLAVRDEWFSDDLRKLDDDNVYRKLQGHWIIEMSEMMATANAKSIEEIKSFLSRQKEVYKIPYETHPADRPRQCVFGGTSNALDFLPLDRSGNRRFIPVMVYPEQAEVHILEDEAASRAYIEQMWAEAMEIYRSGRFKRASQIREFVNCNLHKLSRIFYIIKNISREIFDLRPSITKEISDSALEMRNILHPHQCFCLVCREYFCSFWHW